jgi:hypothetical protein
MTKLAINKPSRLKYKRQMHKCFCRERETLMRERERENLERDALNLDLTESSFLMALVVVILDNWM